MTDLPLGKQVDAPRHVDASVLRSIDRAVARERLGVGEPLPFDGEDVWRCYELSWLRPGGLPRIGVLTLRIPCASVATVESKSLKLYLNGFAHTEFASAEVVAMRIAADLEVLTGAAVAAELAEGPGDGTASDFSSFCLDGLPVGVDRYEPDAALLERTGSRRAEKPFTRTCSVPSVRSRPNRTGARSPCRGAASSSIAPACSATWCPSAMPQASTKM